MPKLSSSLKWRNNLKDKQITTLISSIILQRKQWIPTLLSNSSLISGLTPHHLHEILLKAQSHAPIPPVPPMGPIYSPSPTPSPVPYQARPCPPPLQPLHPCQTPSRTSRPILPFFISPSTRSFAHLPLQPIPIPSSQLRPRGLTRRCRMMIPEALESFRFIMVCGCIPSTRSYNAFLGSLCSSTQIRKAWSFHASALRIGAVPDGRTWSLLAKLLCKEGKLENAEKVLGLDCCDVPTYDFVVDCYSKKGDFKSAIHLLRVMIDKGLGPTFCTYGAILDGSCEFGDARVVGFVLKEMIVKGLLPMVPCLDYDWVIRRLCELEKTFAAEMFFDRARKWEYELDNASFVCLLKGLSRIGRVEQALKVFEDMSQKGVEMDNGCLDVFVCGICKGEPMKEVSSVLKDLIGKGFVPRASHLSEYVAVLCSGGWWIEAGDLWNVAVEKSILLDAHCSCSLVEYYCREGLVDSAIVLHDKMMKLGGCLDVTSCNSLLAVLAERRIEDASQVFDYMRRRNVLNSGSYVIMVGSLCRKREMRKAMELHDEMLKVGLKPDDSIYKDLISGFA
ncbi:hypothetical protein J5N97_011571 [Dioscorea zingiberensis]|uniref:Pentatricopeptide repeat-containing protein n=1 Tax=Dioscorea zingiberensis TaxID=325984 RepID=A0A9D5D0U3_9LILI|nr:hypothetical protein J5N97_011571 [Dioscorea zingiberensis]